MLLKSLGFALGFVVAPIILKAFTLPKMVLIFHGILITTIFFILLYSVGIWKKIREVKQSV